MKKYLIAILGPTAVGKTAMSIYIAKHFDTEIVSCDSRQFFKEMKIGTSPPSEQQLTIVPHYLIGHKSILDEYNVGIYEKEALEYLEQIHSKKNTAVIVGGSGLYANAVVRGLDDFPNVDVQVKERLNKQLKIEGITPLINKLKELDINYYNIVDKNNPQRVIRALEICISTGKPYSSFRNNTPKSRPFEVIKIGLNLNRKKLYDKINQRVDMMMREGLLLEVERLIPYKHQNALQTLGYRELFDYFDRKYSLDFAVEEMKKNTRRYAKRQLTWFGNDPQIRWFAPHQISDVIDDIEQTIN